MRNPKLAHILVIIISGKDSPEKVFPGTVVIFFLDTQADKLLHNRVLSDGVIKSYQVTVRILNFKS